MRNAIITGLLLTGVVSVGVVLANQVTQAPASTRTPAVASPVAAPTYYGDVRPILEANCAGCHTAGGIAPFSLTEPTAAQRMAPAIAAATSSGHMPPWPPGGNTPPLKHERKLTQQEISVLQSWANTGATLGDPARAAPVPASSIPTIRADLTIAMDRAYVPNDRMSDDYRCFVLDPKFTEDRFVTGYNIVPGVPSQVHHVILFQLPASERDEALRRNGQDGRDGWQCFGGPGIGGTRGLEGSLGSWTPGAVPSVTPEGSGALVKAGNLLIMQVHYNLAGGKQPDQTKVQLQLAPTNAKLDPITYLAFVAPVELPCPPGTAGEACDRREALRRGVRLEGPNVVTFAQALLSMCGKTLDDYAGQNANRVTSSCERTIRRDATIVGATLHMHTRGTSTRIELNPGTPEARTLLDIPHWDFHWQGGYTYQTPVRLKAGDIVRITCTWDNTTVKPPRYVIWGEGTDDEMCLGALAVR